MSSGELLLTFIVALFVFGPKKLPMLAEHLGQLFRYMMTLKQNAVALWQLQDNQRRAEKADAAYQDRH